jgi:hypothetical protein
MYKRKKTDHLDGLMNIKGDVNINTNAGKTLYSVALLPEVENFLELGTQWGTSAECISFGLKESTGHLDTVEFIEERYKYASEMLKNLPVTCHLGKSFNESGVDTHYSNGSETKTMSQKSILEKLVSEKDYQAAFLDTCSATQSKEFNFLETNTNIKYIIMHEPNIKCNDVLNRLNNNNNNVWRLLEDGYDNINNHKVYYTLHERI